MTSSSRYESAVVTIRTETHITVKSSTGRLLINHDNLDLLSSFNPHHQTQFGESDVETGTYKFRSSGLGFFVEDHKIITTASLVLVPPGFDDYVISRQVPPLRGELSRVDRILIEVSIRGKVIVYQGQIIGLDPKTNLAIINIPTPPVSTPLGPGGEDIELIEDTVAQWNSALPNISEHIIPLTLGSSRELISGQNINVLGIDYGMSESLSCSVVNGRFHNLQTQQEEVKVNLFIPKTWIGAPLINEEDKVVAFINHSSGGPAQSSWGPSFDLLRVLSSQVKMVSDPLGPYLKVRSGYLGLKIAPLTAYDVVEPDKRLKGFRIIDVENTDKMISPALGLLDIGDILTSIDHRSINRTVPSIIIAEHAPGDVITLAYRKSSDHFAKEHQAEVALLDNARDVSDRAGIEPHTVYLDLRGESLNREQFLGRFGAKEKMKEVGWI